jgi:glycosyltransferase involved in cell wall biosynthesis
MPSYPSTTKIDVGYCGVHTAFQCALAAQELGLLRTFTGSLFDAPGKWGGFASRFLGPEKLRNRRLDGLNPDQLREYPWPWIRDSLRRRLGSRGESLAMFEAFDAHCARQLTLSPPSLFVGTERCDLLTLQAARRLGVRTLHDCPQLHPVSLQLLMQQASDACNIPWPGFPDGEGMKARKLAEFDLADRLMVYSEVQERSFIQQGTDAQRIFQNPLWVDLDFWHPVNPAPSTISHLPSSAAKPPLRLLFVGELSMRKGLPFLFEALKLLDAPVQLTLAGLPTGQVPIPEKIGHALVTATGPVTKHRLREFYSNHDLLVLPSVADAFGWVAVEAMACGIPVLLTDNCGAPVPDPSWRVPALDSRAIAARLQYYLDKPSRLADDASLARPCASQFTPARFRDQIKPVYRELLN